jgi:hypothetical protein
VVDVALFEGGVRLAPLRLPLACRIEDVVREVDAHGASGRDETRELNGDGARSAPDVQEVLARFEVREQEPRGVLRGTPSVAAQHRFVMAVRVAIVGSRHVWRLVNGQRGRHARGA